jgi:hypothetical protein
MAASGISSCFYTSEPFSGRAATRKIRSVDVPFSCARYTRRKIGLQTVDGREREKKRESGRERGGRERERERERDFEPRQLITLNYTSYTLDRAEHARH